MKFKNQIITSSSGFTLIEVLVALLIVALGMLGNAMLQLQGMKNSNDAYMRSQIGIIASEIADKVRANRECQEKYAEPGNFFADAYTVGTSTIGGTCSYTSELGSAGMANERSCIGKILEQSLPAGTVVNLTINEKFFKPTRGGVTSASNSKSINLFTLKIRWTDRDGEEHNIDYLFDPGSCVNATCNCG
tara:strand:- start:4493 stop:5062 length:570 start_codon:yes stop_codon:yes gene_type:complete